MSAIPSMDKLYSMSNQMIITKAEIDSLGHFQFELDFLPKENKLYRLHLQKQGDSPNSLIIGGEDENFMFILLHRDTTVQMEIKATSPPFKAVRFENSPLNESLNSIARLVYRSDSTAEESDFLMGQFLDAKLNDELIQMADSAPHPLIALFALYQSDFEASNNQNQEAIQSIVGKGDAKNSPYLSSFQNKFSPYRKDNPLWIIVLTAFFGILIGFLLGRIKFKSKDSLQTLSVQERKVYALLKSGASNQEIASHFNIGISTVKTHVSSILNKLKVKSRKELME